jgi:hypothetical protein
MRPKKAGNADNFSLILSRHCGASAATRRQGLVSRLGILGDEAMSDVQCDRFDDLTEQGGSTIREPGSRWSPRRSALFLVISSVGLWALIALAVELFG